MTSPLNTLKQMFKLMEREAHYHSEVNYFLNRPTVEPDNQWLDPGTDAYVRQLRSLSEEQVGDKDQRDAA